MAFKGRACPRPVLALVPRTCRGRRASCAPQVVRVDASRTRHVGLRRGARGRAATRTPGTGPDRAQALRALIWSFMRAPGPRGACHALRGQCTEIRATSSRIWVVGGIRIENST